MPMRSLSHLRRELALRQSLERVYDVREPEPDGWARYAREGNQRGMRRAQLAIASASESLDWSFDSKGVVGNAIRMSHLQEIAGALGQALRGLGRDELLYEPQAMVPGVTVHQLTDPYVAATVPGSFQLRVVAPPVEEQLRIGMPTLFERSVDRLIAIFRAGGDDVGGEGLTDTLSGLRSATLNGIKNLAQIISEGSPSEVRWRGETLLAITPPSADRVAEAIREAAPVETSTTIRGELRASDLDGAFRIVTATPTGETRPYSGGVEPEIRETLKSITLGSHVRAELKVTVFDAPFRDEPRETYVLSDIAEVSG